jgi:phosphatidylinositol alpha-1,6-mannosyltransferase
VIANSKFTERQLVDLEVPKNKIVIISPGVDTERFHPNYEVSDLKSLIGVSDPCKVVLSVGRLSRRKGFDNLIRALSLFRHEEQCDFRYVLIGVGEDREYLEQLAKVQGIAKQVHFMGHVAMDDLPRWYNLCDVFAMPNREIDGDTEGFGMVFMEAAACGKPSIAGRDGGTGDAVIDGETGLQVDGNNIADIVDALRRILVNDAFAAKLAERAYHRTITEFDWSCVSAKTLEVCEL